MRAADDATEPPRASSAERSARKASATKGSVSKGTSTKGTTSKSTGSKDTAAGRRAPNPARRNETTRRAILDAALDLVVAKGFEGLSVEAIAARAGVGKQTIYRWWPSKGAVLLDAFTEHRVEDRSSVELLGELDTGDFVRDVRRVLRDTIRAFATPAWEAPYRAIIVAIQSDPELAARAFDRLVGPSLDDVRTWLTRARSRGELRADVDLDVAAELLLGPIFHRWLLRSGPLTDAYATSLADAAVIALAPHPPA